MHVQATAGVHLSERGQLAIRDVALRIRRGELHAIPNREGAVCFAIEGDALEPTRVITDALARVARHRDAIVLRMDLHHARVLACGDAERPAAPRVADDVAPFRAAPPIGGRRL